ncbi:NGG1p interacting factor NIF3 [Methylomicrobium sp. Wu6]|uniref:NGG1p interacting factor NIF3 n=1 Tax=Methylomicrobium sp. Wu6 TaxID=3107928 RepID=UPI002DD65CD9|nr:NGG1p interacting factor NIF3 [Methylomicrobium sp. Wu6]
MKNPVLPKGYAACPENSMYQLCFYVPESHLEAVKAALFAQGAGHYEAYDRCCWQVRGEGQFRPLAGSRPHVGESDRLERLAEYKVEMICRNEVIQAVVQTLLAVHPYEEPAYHFYKILTASDL